MEIKKLVPSGYCKGVINAIKIAKQARIDYPNQKIYVLGMLVHNQFVSKQLEQLNIITLDDSQRSKDKLLDEITDGIIIFTAHGISKKIKQKVIDKGLKYVDASCEDVLKTHKIIKEYLSNGYEVIYFGKRNHPEAEAVLSISDKIHLVCNIDELEKNRINAFKLFLTNQTTMSYLEISDLIKRAKELYPDIVIQDEICNATSLRQKALSNLHDCDLLYVVGDSRSNNTRKLFEIGQSQNIKKVLMITDYQQINPKDLQGVKKVYVTGGASTPPEIINEVIAHLSTDFS